MVTKNIFGKRAIYTMIKFVTLIYIFPQYLSMNSYFYTVIREDENNIAAPDVLHCMVEAFINAGNGRIFIRAVI